MIDINRYFDQINLLDYIPQGVFIINADLSVLAWNRCLENWSKVSKGDIVGEKIDKFFPNIAQPLIYERIKGIFEGGPPTIFSSQLHKSIIPSTNSNGVERIQHTIVTAVKLNTQEYVAMFAIQDVTDFTLRMRKHFLLSKQLQTSNQELEAFTYSISHDLRAPLRAISGFSSLLEKNLSEVLTEEDREFLGIIKESSQEMDGLINHLLKISRIGRQELLIETINLNELIADMLKNKDSIIKVINTKTQFKIEPEMPVLIADKGLLKRVLTNLLSNAIKFTVHSKQPLIEVGSLAIKNQITYYVKDNGVGFDMQYADKVFGVFKRLHTADQFEGSGVGLAIVLRIIKKHNGEVWVESEKNKGTTIFFTIGEVDGSHQKNTHH